MHVLAISFESASDAVIQLGIGGLAIWMIFKLLTPVVAAMVRSIDSVTSTQKDIAQAIASVAGLINAMHRDLATHIAADAGVGKAIVEHLGRLRQLGKAHPDG